MSNDSSRKYLQCPDVHGAYRLSEDSVTLIFSPKGYHLDEIVLSKEDIDTLAALVKENT